MMAMSVGRRTFLAGLAGAGAVGRGAAQSRSRLEVPKVDSLEVLFLDDGAVFSFAEPERREGLTVLRGAPVTANPRRRLAAEFGLSLAATSFRAGERRTVLIDFGYSPTILANNIELLKFSVPNVDAAVLSHGHFDHFGGLAGVLGKGGLRSGTPFRVGGEEAFCERVRPGAERLSFGKLDRGMLGRAGLSLEIEPGPKLFADHAFTTGRIPFVSNERPIVPTRMLPGRGCERALLDPAKRSAAIIQDDAVHELGTAYHLRGRGLVVIGSCSHRGILNTIRQAQLVSGIERVHAVIGGFHLVRPQTSAQAIDTARQMSLLAPSFVIPGHCTGEAFIQAASALMPNRVIRPYVGSRFIFGPGAH